MQIRKNFYSAYKILLGIYFIFVIFAFIADTPYEILRGLKNIILTPDILISDYIEIGGIGATLINAALTSFFSVMFLIINGIKPNGSTIMALWLMTGFSFFGKNILNIWPVMFGVYLFAKYQKDPFRNYTLVTLLGTSLAPTVTQLSFTGLFKPGLGIFLGVLLGIVTGFILAPIASYCIKSHNGYNLYNIGFAAGLLSIFTMSLFRGLGIDFEGQSIWYSGNNTLLFIFIIIISLYLIIVGFIMSTDTKTKLIKIYKQSGRLISDFYFLFGESTYINMGLLGIFSALFVLFIGADFNGPTIAGIITILGFGCFGKHLRNVTPLIIGATLAAIINVEPFNSPNLIVSILFSTCLAPIAGKFGWKVGILAGFVHVNMVSNLSFLQGGLNLYNNGLAGGLTAMILLPLITTFTKEIA